MGLKIGLNGMDAKTDITNNKVYIKVHAYYYCNT